MGSPYRKWFKNTVTASMFAIVLLPCSTAWGEEEAQPAQMKGRVGIGADFQGFGVRYWVSERTAMDLKLSFNAQDTDFKSDTSISDGGGEGYGVGLFSVLVLAHKGGLRLVGLLGVQYNRSRNKTDQPNFQFTNESRYWAGSLNCGLGAEYSFTELPDLSFGVFFNGIGVGYQKTENETISSGISSVSTQDTTYVTSSPQGGLFVRYYF